MKKVLTYLAFFLLLKINFQLLLISTSLAQNDPWTQMVGNGFGSTNQNNVFTLDAFKNQLYAGTLTQNGPGPGQLWKSSTGNNGSFTKVTSYSPALKGSDLGVVSLAHTDLTPGYIYMGTNNNSAGGVIYRSSDGISWTKISKRGMGNVKNSKFTPVPVVFKASTSTQSYLYAGTRDNASGLSVSIWRTLYNDADSTHWAKVCDFSTLDTSATNVTWLYVWNNKIYACCDGKKGHLYESTNGQTWTKNTGSGIGFGVSTNNHIAALAEYKGFLFATTFNPSTGGQVWKTSDGTVWTQVTGNAFGQGANIDELRRTIVANGWLWITGQWFTGTTVGDLVWRSNDGINFTQSNISGFGSTTNNGGFPCISGFNGFVYHGIANNVTGAQVWRTNVGVPIAGFTLSDTTVCEGSIVTLTDSSQVTLSYEWQLDGITFDTIANTSHAFNTAGIYTLSLIAKNGSLADTLSHIITVKVCTGLKQIDSKELEFQIYPNPFSGKTSLSYFLATDSPAKIEIYNLSGKKISTLADEKQKTGKHEISFNFAKTIFSEGIYLFKIKTENLNVTKKLIVLK